jgi:hypothetical protein
MGGALRKGKKRRQQKHATEFLHDENILGKNTLYMGIIQGSKN